MDVPMWLHNTIRKQQKISNLKCFACCYSACMHSFNCAQDFIRGWKSWHDDEIHRWCLCKTVLWGGFRAVFSQQYGSNEACATSQNRRKKKKKDARRKKKSLRGCVDICAAFKLRKVIWIVGGLALSPGIWLLFSSFLRSLRMKSATEASTSLLRDCPVSVLSPRKQCPPLKGNAQMRFKWRVHSLHTSNTYFEIKNRITTLCVPF